jgi:hypothetical protein
VLTSIHLNCQFSLEADKIENVAFDRRLAPKFELSKTSASEQLPHPVFGIRRVTAQPFGVLARDSFGWPMVKSGWH